MNLSPGTRLGPYEILNPIGAGGMGEVYRAQDTRLKRTVAIKILRYHASEGSESKKRFEREAQVISQLSHPHICTLYDVGHHEQSDYIVMEYLQGETLAARLAERQLKTGEIFEIAIQIAGALCQAHRHGIIHRDLKPGNIILTGSGAKLLDFGLAKLKTPDSIEPSTELSTEDASLTREGSILGTLQYMAPEQLEGKEADERTDIFAFGTILYEMITGQKAFSGKSRASLIAAILTSEPAPISRVDPLPYEPLNHLIQRCMAKKPEDRWQTARDVMLELKWVSGEENTAITKVENKIIPRRRETAWMAAAASFLILSAILGYAYFRSTPPQPRAVSFQVFAPTKDGFSNTIALSPDGSQLAFVAPNPDGRDVLWIRPLDAVDSHPLSGTTGAAYPFWSPDSRSIGFFADGKLKKISISESAAQTIGAVSDPRGGSWNSENTIIFSANGGTRIYRVSAEGGSISLVTIRNEATPEVYARWPHFLPNGRDFLFFLLSSASANQSPGIAVGSLDSPGIKFLMNADSSGEYSPPGYLLFIRGDTLMKQPFDASRLQIRGDPTPLAEQVWSTPVIAALTAFSCSTNGIVSYRTGGPQKSQFFWFDRNGNSLGPLGPPGPWAEVDLSPDERSIVVSGFSTSMTGSDIWQIDLQRGTTTRLTSGPTFKVTPIWAGDGSHFAHSSFPEGAVYESALDGSEKKKLFQMPDKFPVLRQWNSNERFILADLMDLKTMKTDLFIIPLLGNRKSHAFQKSDFYNECPQLSPDGHWLSYVSDESGLFEVYVQSYPASSAKRRISTNGGRSPAWRKDGKELFYVAPDNRIMSVDIKTEPEFEASLPKVLFRTRMPALTEARNHYVVTSDGQRFLVNTISEESTSAPISVLVNWNAGLR
jgi:eukaryotic-like serine/threonine-protein kinase